MESPQGKNMNQVEFIEKFKKPETTVFMDPAMADNGKFYSGLGIEYAKKLGSSLTGGEVIAYFGGLGMGKTCFTRGLARGLGFGDDLEYADELTLGRSIANRQPFKI